ncbi:hypothetical protein A0J61_09193 [Choanephora cucurbitarum]|uniref:Uncharacterized protein n=1 Tax=Choanephora cucurbitarum TaxID=101091 RepID=A0A1C7N176_9FUNG|nr:hypothetical protein A0J61_09193 [Choanephora cucurbitarum]
MARCEVYIQSRSTGLIDMETWIRNKGSYADGIDYTGQDQRLLMKVFSGDLEENLNHTLGDLLKLLEDLMAIVNTYCAKYLNSNKLAFAKLKVFEIQCINTTITLVSSWYLTRIPKTFNERYYLLSLFELLAYLIICIVNKVICRYVRMQLILL